VSRIPTSIISGFLGSGKTTLINGLLRAPRMHGTVVVVNEFGEVGIDNDLVVQSADKVVVLENGCLCCSMRGELSKTLDDLYRRYQRGEIPEFSRVLVETTGLADPWPIQGLLTTDITLKSRYAVTRIVSTVDAVNWARTSEQWPEAIKQVTAADCLVVTKSDLVPDRAALAALHEQLGSINPGAKLLAIVAGECEPDILFADEVVQEWFRRFDGRKSVLELGGGFQHRAHLADVQSYCLIRDEPIALEALELFMRYLRESCGERLLRVKGLVHTIEQPGQPVVVQAAQDLVHSQTWLPDWPTADRRTRIVCIGKGLPSRDLEDLLRIAIRSCQTLL
jgi:G3E family GTPase